MSGGPPARPPQPRRMAVVGAALVMTLASLGQLADGGWGDGLHGGGSVVASGARLESWVRDYGYTGSTGGSLGDDDGFLTGLRTRVAQLAAAGSAPAPLAGGARSVLVLWAADHGGRRLALVGYQPSPSGGTELTLGLLSGASGQHASALRFDLGTALTLTDDVRGKAASLQAGDLVLVVAPQARSVAVASDLQYAPDGRISATWTPLTRDGDLVWTGTATAAELAIGRMRVDGGTLSLNTVSTRARAQVQAALGGTSSGAASELGRVASVLAALAPSAQEKAVLARTSDLGPAGRLTAGVLRSAEGGYLIGWSLRSGGHRHQGASLATTPARSPADLLAAVQFAGPPSAAWVAVVAPEGAVTVRSGGVSAPVEGRLAVLHLTAARPGNLDATGTTTGVEALDATGQVIATTTAALPRPAPNP